MLSTTKSKTTKMTMTKTMSMTTVFLLLSSLFLSCFSIPKYLLVETANSPKEQKKPHHHVSEDCKQINDDYKNEHNSTSTIFKN